MAFDAFPIFDARPIFALTDTLFPSKGADLRKAWSTRPFEHQWLRALSGRYVDFWRAIEDGLLFASKQMNDANREPLMKAYLELNAWPYIPQALQSLKDLWHSVGFSFQYDTRDA